MKTSEVEFVKNELGKIRAYCDMVSPCEKEVVVCEVSRCDLDCLWSEFSSLYKYISRLEEQLYRHENNGHLPPIPGADKMEKALDALGLSNDFLVEKRRIYSSDGSLKTVNLLIKGKE